MKRTNTKRALDLEDQHSKLRPSLSTRRKRLKIPREENKHTNVPLALKDRTFKSKPSLSTRRKYLTVPGEENKHPNCVLTQKTELSSQRSRLSSLKSTPKDGDLIKGFKIY